MTELRLLKKVQVLGIWAVEVTLFPVALRRSKTKVAQVLMSGAEPCHLVLRFSIREWNWRDSNLLRSEMVQLFKECYQLAARKRRSHRGFHRVRLVDLVHIGAMHLFLWWKLVITPVIRSFESQSNQVHKMMFRRPRWELVNLLAKVCNPVCLEMFLARYSYPLHPLLPLPCSQVRQRCCRQRSLLC